MTAPTNLGESIARATQRLQQQREAARASSAAIAEQRAQQEEGTRTGEPKEGQA